LKLIKSFRNHCFSDNSDWATILTTTYDKQKSSVLFIHIWLLLIPIARNAIVLQLYVFAFCMALQIKSLRDACNPVESLFGCHCKKNMCRHGNCPLGVTIMRFPAFACDKSWCICSTDEPATLNIVFLNSSDDDATTIASTWKRSSKKTLSINYLSKIYSYVFCCKITFTNRDDII
jgi:hypothetical protein